MRMFACSKQMSGTGCVCTCLKWHGPSSRHKDLTLKGSQQNFTLVQTQTLHSFRTLSTKIYSLENDLDDHT